MQKTETRSEIEFLHLKVNSARQVHDEMGIMFRHMTLLWSEKVISKLAMSVTDEPRTERPSRTDDMATKKKLMDFSWKTSEQPSQWSSRKLDFVMVVCGKLFTTHYSCLGWLHGGFTKGVRFYTDNAAAYSSRGCEIKVLWLWNLAVFSFSSLDLATSCLLLFPEMKNSLRVRRFNDKNDVIQLVGQWFLTQSRPVEGQEKTQRVNFSSVMYIRTTKYTGKISYT